MGKRFWSLALSMALIGGVFSVLPARAQEAPATVVPAVVNIEDVAGDANYLNDQGVGAPIPGDQVLPASAGTVSDILKAWFTSTPDTVSAHILTTAAPPASTPLIFHVRVDPGEGAECLWFRASFPSIVQGQEDPVVPKAASLRDTCATALGIQDGELKVEENADGNGIITMTFPKSLHPALADGNTLKAPTADSRNFPGGQLTLPQIDDTLPGTDFTITSGVAGGPGKPSEPVEPPGKGDPPGKGKKKGCGKGKGKQKGACPGKKTPKPAASCAPYTPGEQGAEAGEAVLVTDAATAEKPVETTIEVGAGVGVGGVFEDAIAHAYKNVQVDSASPSTGLYVRLEMPYPSDYDLYVNNPDGTTAARAAGFNPEPAVYNDTEAGGHTESDAEQIDGLTTSDCTGYTIDVAAATGEGGELTLKFWLGEATYTPAAPGEQTAADMFFGAMRMANPMADSAQASSTPAADKGCKKGKGKKKGCKKPPVACATFVPGEAGTDKPLLTVTDAATEEAPVEQTINLDLSTADVAGDPTSDAFNIQVDSAAADAGLYVLFEFPMRRDYDLNLLHPDGSYAARSRRFNTVSETTDQGPFPISANGHGGAGTDASEKLDGIRTADCGGWTLEAENWLGEGGEFTIKVWLGEAKVDPQAPGEEPPA